MAWAPARTGRPEARLDKLHSILFCVAALVDNLHLLEDGALARLARTCTPLVSLTRQEIGASTHQEAAA